MDIQEKKAFEIAFKNKLGAHCCQFDLDEDGNYEDRETLCGWHMWLEAKAESHKSASLYQFEINHLAAANQQWRDYAAKAQAVPEGFVVVDSEPNRKVLEKLSYIFPDICDSRIFVAAYKAMIEAQEPAND